MSYLFSSASEGVMEPKKVHKEKQEVKEWRRKKKLQQREEQKKQMENLRK